MSRSVLPPDLEAFLTGYLRAVLGVETDVKVPSGWDGTTTLVTVRDDGGPMTGPTTFDRSVGVTVYAGSRQDVSESRALARRAFAALTSPTIAWEKGSPIAAVIEGGCNGPYQATDDHDAAVSYMTVEYSAVGEIEDVGLWARKGARHGS